MNLIRDIKIWDGSKNRAFEELITQIALQERPKGSQFYAVHGKGGDGGVDCYCILPDGKKWGWQSKFVTNLSATSLKQIDKSIKAALSNHPELIKYFVCLPINRTSKKNSNQSNEITKWNDKVKEWKNFANTQNIKIEFEYLGESEIVEFLQRNENMGMNYFWFNELIFSDQWFQNHLQEMKMTAGARYTPQLNVELNISKIFEGLGRTKEFYFSLRKMAKRLKEKFSLFELYLFKFKLEENNKQFFDNIKEQTLEIYSIFNTVNSGSLTEINFKGAVNYTQESLSLLNVITESITAETLITSKSPNDNEYESFGYHSRRLRYIYNEIIEYCEGDQALSANNQCIFLQGDWGTGKTHLFCDLTEHRIKNHNYSAMIFGEKLTGTSLFPLDFLNRTLDISAKSLEEMFGAFDALGKTFDGRSIIFIDALNENKGKDYWINHLVSLRNKLINYPNVALALSCRTTYENYVKPENLDCINLVHNGFEQQAFDAVTDYFTYYNIQLPTFPLLNPEFSRPMFLKLFCEGLVKSNIKSFPEGTFGINIIFEMYLKAVEDKINLKLGFLPNLHYVKKSIDALVEEMLAMGADYIEYSKAFEIINDIKSCIKETDSLFYALISEGILSEINVYNLGNCVRFSYERFSDFFKAKHLLNGITTKNITQNFKNGKLSFLVEKESLFMYRGVIEALSIIFPEKYNRELFEFLNYNKEEEIFYIFEPFLQSLIWRDKKKVTMVTEKYFKRILNLSDYWLEYGFDILISIAPIPNHTFDVYWLHSKLIKWELSFRDMCWSLTTHKIYNEGSSIDKLLHWCQKLENTENFDKSSIYNTSIIMTWLLTNSNRELRDRATKGLVNILKDNLELLLDLLKLFENVNDMYVLERLYCISYGCVLLSKNNEGIKNISSYFFNKQFKNGKPTYHVLIRDYARQTIEYSLIIGNKLNKKELELIRPPYKSTLPRKYPPENIWKKYSHENGYGSLQFSLGIAGDFYRYILGGNHSDSFLDRNISSKKVQRWILKKVIDMGWTPERFKETEKFYLNNKYERSEHKIERIGKKYQWIAYYEIAALVLDNCKINKRHKIFSTNDTYKGPWEYHMRNIDPSNIVYSKENTQKENYDWEPRYNFPLKIDQEWMNSKEDIPKIENLILVTDEFYKKKFFNCEMLWITQEKDEYEFNNNMIELWIWVRGFFVKKDDTKKVIKFINNKVSREYDPIQNYSAFLGEHFWADSIEYKAHPIVDDFYNRDKLPSPIFPTASVYKFESVYDYSKTYSKSANLPSSWFAENAKLKWSKKGFSFLDNNNEVVCYDPSKDIKENFEISEKPNVLLVEQKFLTKFLSDNDLNLIWIVFGEKTFFKIDNHSHPYGRLNIAGVYTIKNNKVTGEFITYPD